MPQPEKYAPTGKIFGHGETRDLRRIVPGAVETSFDGCQTISADKPPMRHDTSTPSELEKGSD